MLSIRTPALLPAHRLHNEMDRIFSNFFGGSGPLTEVEHRFPVFNAWEEDDAYIVEAELPGVKSDDVEINVEGQTLTISGNWKNEHEEKPEKGSEEKGVSYLRRERASGSFRRVISLPDEVDADRVEASLRDGLLKLSLPKVEEAKPKRIEVKTG